MNHLKNFRLFEAIIIPEELEDVPHFGSVEQLSDFARNNGFDVVGYDEFYNSLSERDKKTAPEKPEFPPRFGQQPIPFFALFHPDRKKPMFVVCDPNFIRIPIFPDILKTVMGHERIHAEQTKRSKVEYILPDPKHTESYFSDKNEIMAFAYTVAKELKNATHTYEEAIKILKGETYGGGPQYKGLMNDIRKTDKKTQKRYNKYIYLYLRNLYGKDDSDGGAPVEIPEPNVPKTTDAKVLEPLEEKRNFVNMKYLRTYENFGGNFWSVEITTSAELNDITEEQAEYIINSNNDEENVSHTEYLRGEMRDHVANKYDGNELASWQVEKSYEMKDNFWKNLTYHITGGVLHAKSSYVVELPDDFDKADVIEWTDGGFHMIQTILPMLNMNKLKNGERDMEKWEKEREFAERLTSNQNIEVEKINPVKE